MSIEKESIEFWWWLAATSPIATTHEFNLDFDGATLGCWKWLFLTLIPHWNGENSRRNIWRDQRCWFKVSKETSAHTWMRAWSLEHLNIVGLFRRQQDLRVSANHTENRDKVLNGEGEGDRALDDLIRLFKSTSQIRIIYAESDHMIFVPPLAEHKVLKN
jgi:hypothetical protein